ncbi:EAL-associated domain-containing protein [Salisediminibacterium selenitireducens]|uniref:EAL-associated domain-containing protein n=1 Tax=Salisediminibacterium selenitireducens TaxID=85683 RepID=UPI00015F93E3|nr:EAL-associated domain-containing protein [Salisediminibacterium selenitireducens]
MFYQGFLFYEASPDFRHKISFSDLMQHKRRHMIDTLTDKLKKRVIFERSLNQTFSLTAKPAFDGFANPDQVIEHFLHCLNNMCLRVYLCDHYGNQISSNYLRQDDDWSIHPEFKGKNWSSRPYFLKNLVEMDIQQSGHLSDPYLDVQTGIELFTFSYPVANGLYLFADFHA